MTKALHLDGASVAQAIDDAAAAAQAAAGNGVRVVTTSGNILAADAGNTILVTGASTINLTTVKGLPTGRYRIVNAGSGKVTVVAGANTTVTSIGAGLILDSHVTGDLTAGVADTYFLAGGAAS